MAEILVFSVSPQKIPDMESCDDFHSNNVLDVNIFVNCLCVFVPSIHGQNWSFIFSSSDLQRRDDSLSIQVNFDTLISFEP